MWWGPRGVWAGCPAVCMGPEGSWGRRAIVAQGTEEWRGRGRGKRQDTLIVGPLTSGRVCCFNH